MDCEAHCRYQEDGSCTLKRTDILRPIDGAVCMQDMWDMEEEQHSS